MGTNEKSAVATDIEKRGYIKNLWFLMLYASYFDYKGKGYETGTAENPDELATLIAEILTKVVELRLRRNLNFNYEPRQEILRRVRGRIDLLKTERNQLLQKGQIACRFEELTIDTPRNRFVRNALEKIAHKVNKPEIANNCRELALRLRQAGVSGIAPTYRQLENQRFGRNDKNDEEMVFVARLADRLSLPDEKDGSNELFSPYSDSALSGLYEKAIAEFYKKVLGTEGWKVLPQKHLKWKKREDEPEAKDYLPDMIPDIILNNKNSERSIILDTKFHEVLREDKRFDKERFIFDKNNIFQIYAYLGSQKNQINSHVKYKAEGLLLYPVFSTGKLDKTFHLGDFKVRFVTIDLQEDVLTIRKNLKEIIDPS